MKYSHTDSQHFLKNPHFVKKMISYAKLAKTRLTLDIGAGNGIIATSLAKSGYQNVVAIEKNHQTFQILKKNCQSFAQIKVIETDFLQFELPKNQDYQIFANIPFHLSSDIIHKLVLADNPPSKIYLIVQKQFAEKLLINRVHFTGQIGAKIAPWFDTKIRCVLKKTDFTPPPAVDAVLLEIKSKSKPNLKPDLKLAYFEFIEKCYHSPSFFDKYNIAKKPSRLTDQDWLNLFNLSE